jgi:ABC-type glycerol-3-phosphate transport system permease component
VLNATGSLVLLPVIVLALLVQRHMVKGMTMGAVKG